MIFIAVKFKVKHEYADQWTDIVNDFTQATRSEPGNLWFEWSRSVDEPDTFVCVEGFRDAVLRPLGPPRRRAGVDVGVPPTGRIAVFAQGGVA